MMEKLTNSIMMVSRRRTSNLININTHHNDPNDDDIKEEEVGGQCSSGEGEEAVAKKLVFNILFNYLILKRGKRQSPKGLLKYYLNQID